MTRLRRRLPTTAAPPPLRPLSPSDPDVVAVLGELADRGERLSLAGAARLAADRAYAAGMAAPDAWRVARPAAAALLRELAELDPDAVALG